MGNILKMQILVLKRVNSLLQIVCKQTNGLLFGVQFKAIFYPHHFFIFLSELLQI